MRRAVLLCAIPVVLAAAPGSAQIYDFRAVALSGTVAPFPETITSAEYRSFQVPRFVSPTEVAYIAEVEITELSTTRFGTQLERASDSFDASIVVASGQLARYLGDLTTVSGLRAPSPFDDESTYITAGGDACIATLESICRIAPGQLPELLAVQFDAAPIFGENADYGFFETDTLRFSSGGDAAFIAAVEGGGFDVITNALMRHTPATGLQIVARSETLVPSRPGNVYVAIDGQNLKINAAGDIAAVAVLDDTNNQNCCDEAIVVFDAGSATPRIIARQGDPVPGLNPGVVYGDFLLADLEFNDAGDVAFIARLAGPGVEFDNRSAVMRHRDGQTGVIARSGSPVPGQAGGVTFRGDFWDNLQMNNAGDIAFETLVDGLSGRGPQAQFVATNGTVRTAAVRGDTAPGASGSQSFLFFSESRLTSDGRLFFAAVVDDGTTERDALFTYSPGIGTRRVAAGGDVVDARVGFGPQDLRTLRNATFWDTFDVSDAGAVTILGRFTDGDEAVLIAEPSDTCRSDVNGDGVVSPADFNAWIIALNTLAPECDQNGDGLCTPADFNAWILNYNNGC